MKVIAKPIRFRIKSEDTTHKVIKVDKVFHIELEKLAGTKMYVFKCQSFINGIEKIFELKFELESCRWMLYKI